VAGVTCGPPRLALHLAIGVLVIGPAVTGRREDRLLGIASSGKRSIGDFRFAGRPVTGAVAS
jgi:hypothetical protein